MNLKISSVEVFIVGNKEITGYYCHLGYNAGILIRRGEFVGRYKRESLSSWDQLRNMVCCGVH